MRYWRNAILITFCWTLALSSVNAGSYPERAVEAAYAFVEVVDQGDTLAAYWSGAALLQLANDEQQWVRQTERVRRLMGETLLRTLKTTRSVSNFSGLPDGDYLLISFETQTTNKQRMVEVLLVQNSTGIPKICAYLIR